MKKNQNKFKKQNMTKKNNTKKTNNKYDTNLEPLWYGFASCFAVLIIFLYLFITKQIP